MAFAICNWSSASDLYKHSLDAYRLYFTKHTKAQTLRETEFVHLVQQDSTWLFHLVEHGGLGKIAQKQVSALFFGRVVLKFPTKVKLNQYMFSSQGTHTDFENLR